MSAHRSTLRSLTILLAAALLTACMGPPPRDPAAIAKAYLEADRFDEASREMEIAVRRQPEDVELRMEAARIHAAAAHVDRAIDHLEAAQGMAPRNPEVAILIGELEQRRGNPTDAYVAFRRAVALVPDDVRAVSGLALSAEALGFDDEAAEAYRHWEELDEPAAPAAPRK